MENTNVKNQQTNEVEQTIKEEVEVMQQSTYNQLVAKLIKENKLYKNYKIKSCKCTVKDNYIQISFTLDKKIKGYLANNNGEFVQSETNLIFTSNFAISGAIKEDEDTAWLKNIIVDNPKVTDNEKCISCMRCVRRCPKGARKISELKSSMILMKIKKECQERKER